ncbi:MAG: hypothetical protein M1827_001014 [Pycnora praestabilis]|nr:MAG: hypothetical protein M1827_001014 [Pycnora praestabilis]
MALYKSRVSPPRRNEDATNFSRPRPSVGLQLQNPTTSSIPKPNISTSPSTIISKSGDTKGRLEAKKPQSNIIRDPGIPQPAKVEARPSGLPRRPSVGASTAQDPPTALAKPSSSRSFGFGLRSGRKTPSTASENSGEKVKDKPQRNVLRRKPSSIGQRSTTASTQSVTSAQASNVSVPVMDSSSFLGGYVDPFPGSVLGVTFPQASSALSYKQNETSKSRNDSTPASTGDIHHGPPSLLTTGQSPQAIQYYTAHSSSPSTRYSESPGPFSRTSTPTSISSHSPGIVIPPKAVSKTRQPSPTRSRPPVTRRRAGASTRNEALTPLDIHGLPSVRESLTSSSSGSTVKAGERSEKKESEVKKHRLSPPPPSPPPRKSSMKFSKARASPGGNAGPSSSISSSRTKLSTSTESFMPSVGVSSPPFVQGGRPTRPSREGAPSLEDYRHPSPIIRSNITRLQTTGHKRRESLEPPSSGSSDNRGTFFSSGSASGSIQTRNGTAGQMHGKSPAPVSASASLPSLSSSPSAGPVLTAQPAGEITAIRRGISPTGASASKSASRFGMFSRRVKTSPVPLEAEKSDKLVRKGPSAGTGHEGYNKHALRGRSGSTTSNSGSWTRSGSAGSTVASGGLTVSSRKSSITSRGEQEMDEFFLDRLNPVVIGGGGGIVENRNIGIGSSQRSSFQSSTGGRPSLESGTSTSVSQVPSKPLIINQQLPGIKFGGPILQSPVEIRSRSRSRSPSKRPTVLRRQSPASIEIAQPSKTPTLAARRSLYRSQVFNEKEPLKIPAPINTAVAPPSPSMNSYDTGQYSIPQTDSTLPQAEDISEGKEGNWLKPKKQQKRPKSPGKWNFFQRLQNSPPKTSNPSDVPVVVARLPTPRPIAHYAMMDSSEQIDTDNLEDILQEVERSYDPITENSISQLSRSSVDNDRKQQVQSVLLPSPPIFSQESMRNPRPASPKVMLRSNDPVSSELLFAPNTTQVKPSRLPQVGRIPRVISTKDRDRSLPVQSFSRPFARPQVVKIATPPTALPGSNPDNAALSAQGFHIVERLVEEHLEDAEREQEHSAVTGLEERDPSEPKEFFAFPPRIASETSYSSSSGIMSFAATTAVIPTPEAALSEDEVWNEYDDLIDDVLSPKTPKTPLSATSSLGFPFRYANFVSSTSADEREQGHEKKIGSPDAGTGTRSSATIIPPTTSAPTSSFSSPCRGSRHFSPLRSSALTSTPSSFAEFFAGYGERNLSITDAANARSSASSGRRISSKSIHSRTASLPEPSKAEKNTRYPDSQLINYTPKVQESDLESYANLRLGALMTSRWLSFGRVLFSPAHVDIKQGRPERVLILDGLGNDDWSFYCAETYPSATIYNLSPSSSNLPTSTARRTSGTWPMPPHNHRQVPHPSIAHPFPFPRGFFAAVVFRFPAASTEAGYRNAISESKRVLRPGGYLEMSILDLDMVNMGNRMRRAVRMLKVRMQVADPEVSLKPVGDSLMKMVGRRGFEGLNRCVVGVPTAGPITGSVDEKSDEVAVQQYSKEEKGKGKTSEGTTANLSDMLKDPSADGDVGITKMVARVGRWWYTRCYEMSVTVDDPRAKDDAGASIWDERALLKECERKGTGLRLLICYAQKPLVARRRAVSV